MRPVEAGLEDCFLDRRRHGQVDKERQPSRRYFEPKHPRSAEVDHQIFFGLPLGLPLRCSCSSLIRFRSLASHPMRLFQFRGRTRSTQNIGQPRLHRTGIGRFNATVNPPVSFQRCTVHLIPGNLFFTMRFTSLMGISQRRARCRQRTRFCCSATYGASALSRRAYSRLCASLLICPPHRARRSRPRSTDDRRAPVEGRHSAGQYARLPLRSAIG